MVLFQLPHRTVLIEADLANFPGPYQVALKINLGPEEFFGSADLTGRLREVLGQVQPHGCSLFQGIKRTPPAEATRARKFTYSGDYSTVPISFDGSVATMDFNVVEIDHLGEFVQRTIEILPAMFAPVTKTPVAITGMSGTVNGIKFDVRMNSALRLTIPGKSILEDYFRMAMPHARTLPLQIIAAKRYLAQSFLLEYSSEFLNQFTGERLLNLCKALDSIIPPVGKFPILAMKATLKEWGVHERYIDVFASIKHLRNKIDSGHERHSVISKEAHERFDRFIVQAEECIESLIITAVKMAINDPTLFPQKAVVVEDSDAILFLANYDDLPSPEGGDLTRLPAERMSEAT